MASSCPHPFLDESLFPSTGGSILGRWCDQLDGVSCCVPCPNSYWRWENVTWLVDDVRLALWPSIPVLMSLVWLLVTYIIFPSHLTERHYLNVAPVVGFICISLGFIIPSRGLPRECYNEITPNEMRTDAISALMGIVLYYGSWVVIISAMFRSVALHITICWEVKLGKAYKNVSLIIIFIGSAALVVVLLTVSGMQYTFGRISYIVPYYDRATFWGPLLAISSASLMLQFVTVIYCMTLILRPWFNYQMLRWLGYTPSPDVTRVLDVQRTALRIRNIIKLQWRNSLITMTILTYVCFLAAIFMKLHQFQDYAESDRRAWFKCLASTKGNRDSCLPLAEPLGPTEPELIAVLFLLVLSGSLAIAFFFRTSMVRAWISLFRGEPRPPTPAHRISHAPRSDGGDSDVEIGNRESSGRLSHFPPSDAGSLSKPRTTPASMT